MFSVKVPELHSHNAEVRQQTPDFLVTMATEFLATARQGSGKGNQFFSVNEIPMNSSEGKFVNG